MESSKISCKPLDVRPGAVKTGTNWRYKCELSTYRCHEMKRSSGCGRRHFSKKITKKRGPGTKPEDKNVNTFRRDQDEAISRGRKGRNSPELWC